jgi:molecular chaperone GrpE
MTWRIYQHPSDREEINLNSQDDENNESVAPPMDPLAQLQADMKTSREEVAEWQDRFLRKAAEFENYRKRTEKEKADLSTHSKSSILVEFLPVADACERALNSFSDNLETQSNLKQYQDGIELLYKQVIDTLRRVGVIPLETEGKPFDPHLHEALSREENEDFEEDTIIREFRRGYLYKDKLLRPAQVIVAVHPRGKDQTTE